MLTIRTHCHPNTEKAAKAEREMRVAADALHKRAEDNFEKTIKREASLRCVRLNERHVLAVAHPLTGACGPFDFPASNSRAKCRA